MKQYPKTDAARKAQIKLVESYRAIKYKEDVAETCGTLEKNYPKDKDVEKVCRGVKATMVADSTVKPTPGAATSPATVPNPPTPVAPTSPTPVPSNGAPAPATTPPRR